MTPIERAARALCDLAGKNPDGIPPYATNPNWTNYVEEARAVLTAIREPSAKHLEAGGELLWAGSRVKADMKAMAVWQAMIDAALAEGQPA